MNAIMLRYHRWRVWRTAPGSDARKRAVRAYLSWHARAYGRLEW